MLENTSRQRLATIIGAWVQVITGHVCIGTTPPSLTGISGGARVTVIAKLLVGREAAAHILIAGIIGARVTIIANEGRWTCDTRAVAARIA